MVKACYLVNVIQLSAREHWHCCLLSHVFFCYNPCHSRCQTGTFLSRYYREKKKDFNDDNNRLSNPLTLIFISIFLFCFFGRRVFNSWCLGFPWRLVGSICPRSMRSFSKTFLSGTMRTSMGLYLGNDRRGWRSCPSRFSVYSRRPSCQTIVASALSYHLQRSVDIFSVTQITATTFSFITSRWSESRLRQWRTTVASIFSPHRFRPIGSHVSPPWWSSWPNAGIWNSLPSWSSFCQ